MIAPRHGLVAILTPSTNGLVALMITSPESPSQWQLRSVEIERDAASLAAMWNAGDDQWPGTFCGGVPMTAERVRDWFAQEQHIDVAIWDTGQAIVGYCSLWRRPEQEHVTYVALLNVAPAFQGQGLARRLLTNSIRQSIELAARRLNLGTWSGNLKAVPLYKKCGFFWVPGTSVDMHNYLPTILTLPCTQSFFARHDWYVAFQRELHQREDDERWEGLKVFTYRFAAGDDQLTVWIDREAQAVTAVETNDYLVAAIADSIAPPRGLPVGLRWRLTNKQDRPVAISLIATGGSELAIDHRATLTLAPGETTTLTATVEVTAGAAEGPPATAAPAVRSLLVVDGQLIELATGLRPRPALAVTTEPAAVSLTPGRSQSLLLQLESGLDYPISAIVGLIPPAGLTTDWRQQRVTIPAKGYGGLPIEVHCTAGGVYELEVALAVEAGERRLALPTTALSLFALPPGGILGAVVDDTIRLENEFCRLTVASEGARLTLADRETGRELVTMVGYPTPPVFPSEYRRGRHTLRLDAGGDGYVVITEMTSRQHPQFSYQRRITLTAGPIVRLDHVFVNQGALERDIALHQTVRSDSEAVTLTLPLRSGLTQASWSDFPGELDDSLKKATAYAEGWAALGFPGRTVGVLWGDDLDDVTSEIGFLTRTYHCQPQSRVAPAPCYLYVGDGDWQAVRRLWRRLAAQSRPAAAPRPPEAGAALLSPDPVDAPLPPVAVWFEPPVGIAYDTTARLHLTVDHRRARPLQGRLDLHLPAGWQAEPRSHELVDLTWRQPVRLDLTLVTTDEPGAAAAKLRLTTTEGDQTVDLPLLRFGDGRSVSTVRQGVAEQTVLTIDNGRLEIAVTPGFGGAVSAIRERGVNWLASAFPTPGTIGWLSPWYGGLTPVLMAPDDDDFPGRLAREHFEAAPIEHVDRYGIRWSGVRQTAHLARDEWRGLTLELETLTVGASPIVWQVLRLHNDTPVARRLMTAGWLIFVQPEADEAGVVVWGPGHQSKPSDRNTWLRTGAWAAAEQPRSGRTLIVIGRGHQAGLAGWGYDGQHLLLTDRLTVPPSASIELTAYLAVADDLAAARRFSALSNLI